MMHPLLRFIVTKAVRSARWSLVWWPALFIALYVKMEMIGGDSLAVAARAVGKTEVMNGDEADWIANFSLLERLSFYRGELLWGLFVLPAISLLLTSGRMTLRWRGTILAGASILLSCLLYAELLSIRAVGRMLSMSLATDALTFADCCAPTARQYFGVRGAVQLTVIALLTVGLSWWAGRQNRNDQDGNPRFSARAAGMLRLCGLAWTIAFAAWLPWLPSVPYHTSVLETAAKTFFFDDALDTSAYAGLTPEQLTPQYRKLTHSPEPRQSCYWETAKDCDVLVFVLETAPARCLAIEGDLWDCPSLARLRERSFVAARHHTTCPYTTRAVFSILSSWYPSTLMKAFPQRHPTLAYGGLMQSLKALGYQTALYAPDAYTYRADDGMYQNLSVERRIYIEKEQEAARSAASSSETDPERRLRLDRDCLQALKTDMHAWGRNGQRFAALFLPQIGHAPWLDFTDGAGADNLTARGRKLIAMQDAWLGEIVDQLAADGRLEKTLIVVVGDHGIRTKREDPAFRSGMVDDYSFHVPLLIYAPAALDARVDVRHVTSHIDIAPSLLDLLGVPTSGGSEQGAQIWDERLKARNTYFLANILNGSDGYYSGEGRYFLWNHTNEAVYENSTFYFDTSCLVSKGSPRNQEIVQHLRSVCALQEVWASSRCCTIPGVPQPSDPVSNAANRSPKGASTY